ncbi:MAG TPA: sulfate transporter family protein [Methylomirabilota bacterium]|nr:sulfate transporter family protein [Methylomirabilota bacterium]
MIAAAVKALSQILSPPFRGVLLRSVGLTLAILAAIWAGLYALLDWLVDVPSPGLETAIQILTGVGLFIGLGFLIAPVTAIFAGLFLDEIAEAVERTYYPLDPPGRAMPIGESIASAIRFTALVVAVNLLVLVLLLLPGINIIAFFVANAYLLGREYFEAVAMRFHDRATVAEMRARHSARIFLAGLLIALVLAIPIVNLLTPLFATAFMVHIFKGSERA